MTKVHSISITDEDSKWLSENEYIKLSKICQEAIRHAREVENQSVSHEENKMLRERIESIMNTVRAFRDFIEKNGLMDDYLKGVQN